jgi:hypothetical protein
MRVPKTSPILNTREIAGKLNGLGDMSKNERREFPSMMSKRKKKS